ncbi:heavy metal-associated isoprenylated plant protein 31-like [Malus domestica]|uniref:heavy metal-associated isoprenylated plant protein 31-like n=1 Tax=Malus domestica TaxID=3750 RepID=UPI003974836F
MGLAFTRTTLIFCVDGLQIVEVRVPNLECEGCASKLKQAVSKLKGVEEVEVEMEIQKIIVRGYASIKGAGKAAEPWPFTGYSPFADLDYLLSLISYSSHSFKLIGRVWDGRSGVHTFFHTPSLYSFAVASDEAIASLFSDDNPHACAIM